MENKSNQRILAILFTVVLMGALDVFFVGPAIPSIEDKLSSEPRMLGWIFSIYVQFNLSGVSLFARLSDIFGRRNIIIISLGIFALGSLIVFISHNFASLLIGRAVQGFGASGIFPVASAVVGAVSYKHSPNQGGNLQPVRLEGDSLPGFNAGSLYLWN
jgi:MFS family permease